MKYYFFRLVFEQTWTRSHNDNDFGHDGYPPVVLLFFDQPVVRSAHRTIEWRHSWCLLVNGI